MCQSVFVLPEIIHTGIGQSQFLLADQPPDTVKQVVAMALYDDLHAGLRNLCHKVNQVGLCFRMQMNFRILHNHRTTFRSCETSNDNFRNKAHPGADMIRVEPFAAVRLMFPDVSTSSR